MPCRPAQSSCRLARTSGRLSMTPASWTRRSSPANRGGEGSTVLKRLRPSSTQRAEKQQYPRAQELPVVSCIEEAPGTQAVRHREAVPAKSATTFSVYASAFPVSERATRPLVGAKMPRTPKRAADRDDDALAWERAMPKLGHTVRKTSHIHGQDSIRGRRQRRLRRFVQLRLN